MTLYFEHVDECPGILEEVPASLFLGTTPVRLTCLDVSANLIVLGSDCSAVFFYNRKLKRGAKRMSTNQVESVSAIRVCSTADSDFLAVGHRSGLVALMLLPSSKDGASKKTGQYLQGDVHKNRVITSLEWTPDGDRLFSADSSGLIMHTTVDFHEHQFVTSFICCENTAIVQMCWTAERLAVSSTDRSILVDIGDSCRVIEIAGSERSQADASMGITLGNFLTKSAIFAAVPRARICVADGMTGHVETMLDLRQEVFRQFLADRAAKTADEEIDPEAENSIVARQNSSGMDMEFSRLYYTADGILLAADANHLAAIDVKISEVPKCLGVVDLRSTKGKNNDFKSFFDVNFSEIPKCLGVVDLRSQSTKGKNNDFKIRDFCWDSATISDGELTIFALVNDRLVLRISNRPAPTEFLQPSSNGKTSNFVKAYLPGALANFDPTAVLTKGAPMLNRLKQPPGGPLSSVALSLGLPLGLVTKTSKSADGTVTVDLMSRLVPTDDEDDENCEIKVKDEPATDTLKSEERPPSASTVTNLLHSAADNLPTWWKSSELPIVMSDLARALVDKVGGVGVQVDDGRPVVQFLDDFRITLNNITGLNEGQLSSSLPPEAIPVHSASPDVVIRRTKRGPHRRDHSQSRNDEKANVENGKTMEQSLMENQLEDEIEFVSSPTVAGLTAALIKKEFPSKSIEPEFSNDNAFIEEDDFSMTTIPTSSSTDFTSGILLQSISYPGRSWNETNTVEKKGHEESRKAAIELEREEEKGQEISNDDEEEENGKAASDVYKRILQVTDRSRNEKKRSLSTDIESMKPIGIPERPATVLSSTRTSGDHYGFCGDDWKTPTAIANDRVDIWSEIPLPYSTSSFAVCSGYVVVCRDKKNKLNKKKKPQFLSTDAVHGAAGTWTMMKNNADAMAVNDSGTLIWRLDGEAAYEAIDAPVNSPSATRWSPIDCAGGGVVDVALTRNAAWYLTKNDGVMALLQLPENGILSRVDCPYGLSAIAASEVAVWALRTGDGHLIVRAGLKHTPIGIDWVEVEPEGPRRLVSITLYGHSGFAMDDIGQLWFTNGVDYHSPFGTSGAWLQMASPIGNDCPTTSLKLSPPSDWQIRVCSAGVFISTGSRLFVSRNAICGHRFRRVIPSKLELNDEFTLLTAGGCDDSNAGESNDNVYVAKSNSELFIYRVAKRILISLPPTPGLGTSNSVMALSATRCSLSVLDNDGRIFVRLGVDAKVAPCGLEWRRIDVTAFENDHIISLACSESSIWLQCVSGKFFVCPQNIAESASGRLKWNQVEAPGTNVGTSFLKETEKAVESSMEKCDRLYASSNGQYVWTMCSSSGRAWARTGINQHCIAGRTWTEACSEPTVGELAVGRSVVWCLAKTTGDSLAAMGGRLHRLRGLAAGNPAGNYWRPVPAFLRAISSTADNRLWAIDHAGRLVRHQVELYPPAAACSLSEMDLSSLVYGGNDDSLKEEFEFI